MDWPAQRLIRLAPAAYAVHAAEEWFGGFPEWTQSIGGGMTRQMFLPLNLAFLPVFAAVCWIAASRTRGAVWLTAVLISTVLFWNAILHIVGTAIWRSYSPGLVSAALIYWPLALWMGAAALRQGMIGRRDLATAMTVGLVVMATIVWAGLFGFQI